MTELLENSDNTNESAVVSESPANEATISLAAVQALADALQKIESYTPTVWVDNESPDIDAAHLNKAEQAIMRVTTAMNSAVDVIKDLQSQVNTTNNNLSKISYSWPIRFVGNSESLRTVVNEYCKTNTSQKYLLNRIADSPFVYDGTTIISGSLTLDYSRGYWDNHPLYTLISDNIVYTGSLDISKWQVDNIFRYVQKSDLEKSGVCIGGIHIYSFANSSSAVTKKFTSTNAKSHMTGLLIVDQNAKTDVYSIGRLSGVQPLLKKSDADLPTISSGVLSVPLVEWGSITFISLDEFTIS